MDIPCLLPGSKYSSSYAQEGALCPVFRPPAVLTGRFLVGELQAHKAGEQMPTPTMHHYSRRLLLLLSLILAPQLISTAAEPEECAVPIIDISALRDPAATGEAKLSVAQAIGRACEDIGFFVVQNHGIDDAVISGGWNATRDFFNLPLEHKIGPLSSLLMTDTFPYGYSPYGGEVLSKGKDLEVEEGSGKGAEKQGKGGDMKEMFAVGPYNPESGMPGPRYPEASVAPGMQEAWVAYYQAMEALASAIMRGFAMALELPETWCGSIIHIHPSSRCVSALQ